MSETALLILDVQIGVVADVAQTETLFATINRLREKARAQNAPVIYVQDIDVEGPDFAIHPAVAPTADDSIIRKAGNDAFFETSLQETMERLGIKHLVITGCKTDRCIDSTCRIIGNLGYDATLVKEGHSTSDNNVLRADQIIAHHNHVLNGFGVRTHGTLVRSVEEIEFLDPWPGHPQG